MPQITAILDCARAAAEHGVPVIADGGIKFSGDVTKALAAGAHSVMIGSLLRRHRGEPRRDHPLPGTHLQGLPRHGLALGHGPRQRRPLFPGERLQENGGIGSLAKLVPEGIEGMVPYKGSVHQMLPQLTGGLRSGMGLAGCSTIDELRTKARFVRISPAGLKEGHAHDVVITKEAPNYWVER